MRLTIRSGVLTSLIVLVAFMLATRLLPLVRVNWYDLATAHNLVVPGGQRSFWDVCLKATAPETRHFGNALEPPPLSSTLTGQPLDGRRLLWKYLAEPDRVGSPDVELDRPKSLDTMFSQLVAGCAALDRQQAQQATAYFTHLPALARGLATFGDSEEAAGHFEVAKNAWDMASRIDHATADIHYGFASFLRRHGGSPDDVLRELNEAVNLAPGNWIYRTALGEVYQEQGQPAPAIQAYSDALSLAPDQGAVYFQRGLAYKDIGALPEACADIQQAIALDAARRDVYTRTLCAWCAQPDLCQEK